MGWKLYQRFWLIYGCESDLPEADDEEDDQIGMAWSFSYVIISNTYSLLLEVRYSVYWIIGFASVWIISDEADDSMHIFTGHNGMWYYLPILSLYNS